jgi:hypothetical protein
MNDTWKRVLGFIAATSAAAGAALPAHTLAHTWLMALAGILGGYGIVSTGTARK